MTINHAWTKARLRIVRENGFGLRALILVDTLRSFPQSGFQLGAVVGGVIGPCLVTLCVLSQNYD